jgi:hypothetical protein
MIYLKNKEGEFDYIYPLSEENMFYLNSSGTPYQLANFIFEYHDSVGIVKTDTLPSFSLKLISVLDYNRLYNIASNNLFNTSGYEFYKGIFIEGIVDKNCKGSSCTYLNDKHLLMINIPNSDFDFIKDSGINKNFNVGWCAYNKNHFFVKATNPNISFIYNILYSTKDILDVYNSNPNKITQVENVKVGDVYAFRYIEPFPESYSLSGNDTTNKQFEGDKYGIIQVTHIENDNLTSLNGGNDNDYIDFRVIYFDKTCRFK